MNLIERLKRIAEEEGVPESQFIWDEARYFQKVHGTHGSYELRVGVMDNDELEYVYVICTAANLQNEEKCPHVGPSLPWEHRHSIIYHYRPIKEIEDQRMWREGRT